MTNQQKKDIAAELAKLKSILESTGNTDLWQRLEDSDGKKAIMSNLEYSIKTIQTQIDNLTLSVPQRIANSFLTKKAGLHINLNPTTQPTAKKFDFSAISRKFTQLLHGEG